jgi:hypothetical protein
MKPLQSLLLFVFASLLVATSSSQAQTTNPSLDAKVLVDTDCEFSGFWSTGPTPWLTEDFIEKPGIIGGFGLAVNGGPTAPGEGIVALFDASASFGEVWLLLPDGASELLGGEGTPDLIFDLQKNFDDATGIWSGTFAVRSTACGVPETGSSLWLLGGGIGFAFAGRRWSKKR